MDENNCLSLMRTLIATCLREPMDTATRVRLSEDALRQMKALDDWLSNGGPLPREWADAGITRLFNQHATQA